MMRAFSLLIFLYSSFGFSECKINPKFNIVSLSGPMSFIFKELDLLGSKNLKAISSFHDIKAVGLKKIGGGLFLSKNELNKLDFNVLFYDQSQELSNKLKKITNARIVEIKTKNLDPFILTQNNLNSLTKYLINCENKIKKIKNQIQMVLTDLKKASWPKCMLFYLGSLADNFDPSLIMVNDGPMKFLIDNKLTSSYQSTLSYVSWSMKEMKNYKNCQKVGLSNSTKSCHKSKISDKKLNISCPGALTPGLTQIKLLKYIHE